MGTLLMLGIVCKQPLLSLNRNVLITLKIPTTPITEKQPSGYQTYSAAKLNFEL